MGNHLRLSMRVDITSFHYGHTERCILLTIDGNIGGKDSKWMTEVAWLMLAISMNKSTEISLAFEIGVGHTILWHYSRCICLLWWAQVETRLHHFGIAKAPTGLLHPILDQSQAQPSGLLSWDNAANQWVRRRRAEDHEIGADQRSMWGCIGQSLKEYRVAILGSSNISFADLPCGRAKVLRAMLWCFSLHEDAFKLDEMHLLYLYRNKLIDLLKWGPHAWADMEDIRPGDWRQRVLLSASWPIQGR